MSSSSVHTDGNAPRMNSARGALIDISRRLLGPGLPHGQPAKDSGAKWNWPGNLEFRAWVNAFWRGGQVRSEAVARLRNVVRFAPAAVTLLCAFARAAPFRPAGSRLWRRAF